jgi:hypothetical protein
MIFQGRPDLRGGFADNPYLHQQASTGSRIRAAITGAPDFRQDME